MTIQKLEYRDQAFPFTDKTYKGVTFKYTDLGTLADVLNSIKNGINIWTHGDGTSRREGVNIYNKELLHGSFVIAFDTEEARTFQIEASNILEGKDTGKYTLPDITTFFEIEKNGKKVYCYVVDRMDMWKHKKDILMGEVDDVSIDGIIVYPAGLAQSGGQIQQIQQSVDGVLGK